MFNEANSNVITSKPKNIFSISFCFSEIYIKLGLLWTRRWASEVISFSNYRFLKVGLLKYLKRPVSEHFWTVNMLKGRKHCLNLHRRNFVRFSHHSERKSVQKNSVLLVSKILRLFVNIFTPGDKYSLSVKTSV